MSLLTAKKVTKNFGGLSAVSMVNMELHENELVGLIGPNGAGKTTLFNLLTGVYTPTSGDILLDTGGAQVKLNGMNPAKINHMGIARTFQNIRLFKELTVLDNVRIAMHQHSGAGTVSSVLRTPQFYKSEEEMKQEALELLSIFGLDKKADTLSKNLPYGDQRCLEIVRALATKPKLLFLDEPAAGMNPQETLDLTRQIDKIQRDFKVTTLLIEHDMGLVMDICQRIYVLEYGRIIAHGTPREIKANPQVIRAYLGEEI